MKGFTPIAICVCVINSLGQTLLALWVLRDFDQPFTEGTMMLLPLIGFCIFLLFVSLYLAWKRETEKYWAFAALVASIISVCNVLILITQLQMHLIKLK